jgi:Flp pilus assembly protein TadG
MIAMYPAMVMLKAETKKRARFQRGNALVEFALVLPVFIGLFMGLVSMSAAEYNQTVLVMATGAAARAGAKYDGSGMTDVLIKGRANTVFSTACSKLISFDGPVATPTPVVTLSSAALPPRRITVQASMVYVGLPWDFFGASWSTFSISASTTMMVES